MIKKYLIGTFAVAAFALAMTASAAYDFGTYTLKVGSRGEAVKTLQTLVGAPVTGYFGSITKAKVMAWQANNGLTADGYFGNASKDKANMAAPATTPVVSGATCPNGMLLANNCAAATPGTTPAVATGKTDGSITTSTSSYVSSGITLKKGETKDVAAVRLQATVGPVKVNRVDVTFNVRPWLFLSKVALHDNAGKVLAEKTLTSIADTTEITVGSSYMVRFDNIDYTVTPGTNPDLAVSASVLAATDKIVTTQSLTTTFTSMRTTSEIGYVDSPTISATNTVTMSATASTADVYSRISPSSPLTGQQVVNANNVTADVTLGAFSLKSTNAASTLNTFVVSVLGTSTASTNFSNFRLYVGGAPVAGGTLSGTSLTFSNLTTPLALDAWTDFTVKADIAAASSGTVYLTLTPNASTVVVTDVNYGTPTIESGARTSNTLTLTQNSVTVSGISAVLGSAIVQSNITTGYNATYAFTLTNNSNNDMYVSATPGTFVSTTTTGGTSSTLSTLSSITLSPATVSGDDASGTYYSIPTGTARTFTFAAALRGSGSATVLRATAINYGTSTGALTANSIATGLSGLSLTAQF